MSLYRAAQAVSSASGEGSIDWDAATGAAREAIDPGRLDLTDAEKGAYADDVRDARDRVREVAGVDFDVPDTVEIQNRHHWIDANVATFRRVIEPLENRVGLFPDMARTVNTGTMALSLAFLGKNVLGQYDPLLLAEAPDDHALYFVHPNIERVASELDVHVGRFRRWIAFHEVTHAAEFGAAPWLTDHLEASLEAAIADLGEGHLDREALSRMNVVMTAVEGYAELLMDRAFDDEYADLRRKLDERRRGGGPLQRLIRRLLGLGMKRRQYERGKEFFEAVADASDLETAALVWERPENLPSDSELDEPRRWLDRVV